MAAFRFHLEPVLRQRRRAEDQRQQELATLQRQVIELESQLRSMQQSISEDKRGMAEALTNRVDVRRIRQHGLHVNQTTQRAQQIAVELAGLRQRFDQARQALLEARRQRKAVEHLKQRRYDRFLAQQKKQEAAEIDEIVTQRYATDQGNQGAVT